MTLYDPELVMFRRLQGELKHYCPDWDYLAIDETCPEFEGCACNMSKAVFPSIDIGKPSVVLVASTVARVKPLGEEIDDGELIELNAEDFVAYSARVSNPANQLSTFSYNKLLAYLQRARHWSPFDMSDAIVEITTTRDIAHQILRHWTFRFQEFSQRYAAASKFQTFKARRQDTKNRQNSFDDLPEDVATWWDDSQREVIEFSFAKYARALELGIAKECARKVLPEGLTVSTLYMKGSLRSWIHYLAVRLDPSAQKEHRDVALACEAVLAEAFPQIFGEKPQEEVQAFQPDIFETFIISYMSTRCDVTSQHKLPTRDELLATSVATVYGPVTINKTIEKLIEAGKIIEYGPYLSDRKIEVL